MEEEDRTKQVYNDLYKPSDPADDTSDTYIALIIKYVFTSENERTKQNARWVQSVLETIFDEEHLSTKIDSEALETWIEAITDTEMNQPNLHCILKVITNVKILLQGSNEEDGCTSPHDGTSDTTEMLLDDSNDYNTLGNEGVEI